jgi:hypothetical protein
VAAGGRAGGLAIAKTHMEKGPRGEGSAHACAGSTDNLAQRRRAGT